VSRVEADGIVIKSKSGISKVYFAELPKDVQERFAVQQAEKISHEVELKDYPGVRGRAPEKVLELVFDRDVPQPQAVDKMLRESLERAVAADGSRDILAMAFLGDEVLSDTQYSGALVYRAAQRKIMTEHEARGVKTSAEATPHQAPMNVAKPAEQAQSTVQQAIEKLERENLLRLDCGRADPKAWIALAAWMSCDARVKENLTKNLAAYCNPKYPSIWILDKQSGRKLASYGPFQGFAAY
jgi:hypothetical protein